MTTHFREPHTWPARPSDAGVSWWCLDARLFGLAALLAEFVAIITLAAVVSATYHFLAYGDAGPWPRYAWLGMVAGLVYLPLRLLRVAQADDWRAPLLAPPSQVLAAWSYTFIVLFLASFLTKDTANWSRMSIALLFVAGALMLAAMRALWRHLLLRGLKRRLLHLPPAIVIGAPRAMRDFRQRLQAGSRVDAMRPMLPMVIATPASTPAEHVRVHLRRAAEQARAIQASEVFLLAPFDRRPLIEMAVDTFLDLPVSLHVGPDPLLDAHPGARLRRFGDMLTMELIRPPLSPTARAAKRLFDFTAAALGLVLLMPVFALIALAIRLDSPGPVFFRQRRRGFNGRTFHIWKFRTMRVMEDGARVVQATANDPRITHVGRFLRRTSLDELPQLINVLKGEMSLVGPRPHALAHDSIFERKVRRYARRYNVLPGITGWAQVNGCRGETDTEEKLRRRVEHDLEYIENASLAFDLYILLRTFFSRRAHDNAI